MLIFERVTGLCYGVYDQVAIAMAQIAEHEEMIVLAGEYVARAKRRMGQWLANTMVTGRSGNSPTMGPLKETGLTTSQSYRFQGVAKKNEALCGDWRRRDFCPSCGIGQVMIAAPGRSCDFDFSPNGMNCSIRADNGFGGVT